MVPAGCFHGFYRKPWISSGARLAGPTLAGQPVPGQARLGPDSVSVERSELSWASKAGSFLGPGISLTLNDRDSILDCKVKCNES